MSRIGLHSADLGRAGDFYSRLFGTEIATSAPDRSRAFGLGDSVLELISAPANAGPGARGLDYIRVTIKDYSAATATRVLRERGIKIDEGRLRDPCASSIRTGCQSNSPRTKGKVVSIDLDEASIPTIPFRGRSTLMRAFRDDPIEINRRNWDDRATVHAREVLGEDWLTRLARGKMCCLRIEAAEVGDVT